MNSEEISVIASRPFIRNFVFSIIQNIRAKNFNYEERSVIHADLVPKVSEKVMQASMKESMTPSIEILPVPVQPPVVMKKRDMSALVAPIERPRPMLQPRVALRPVMPPMPVAPPRPIQPMAQVPQAPQGSGLSQEYGKITPLLNDASVSTIECSGIGKPLMIIRTGQRQTTKISLSGDDIKEILMKVSDAVHIPLLEGVFRAAVDNFSINAIISEIIGSRFVIKKQTAYALLEQ